MMPNRQAHAFSRWPRPACPSTCSGAGLVLLLAALQAVKSTAVPQCLLSLRRAQALCVHSCHSPPTGVPCFTWKDVHIKLLSLPTSPGSVGENPPGSGWSGGYRTWSPGTSGRRKPRGRWTCGFWHKRDGSKCGSRCTRSWAVQQRASCRNRSQDPRNHHLQGKGNSRQRDHIRMSQGRDYTARKG